MYVLCIIIKIFDKYSFWMWKNYIWYGSWYFSVRRQTAFRWIGWQSSYNFSFGYFIILMWNEWYKRRIEFRSDIVDCVPLHEYECLAECMTGSNYLMTCVFLYSYFECFPKKRQYTNIYHNNNNNNNTTNHWNAV